MKIREKPIGIFDSGIGGLTVVKEIQKLLPNEEIIYFGDTARVPYGTKSRETILKFAKENTDFLLSKDVKLIIVACNTVSAIAVEYLENNYNLPISGVLKPGSKKAAKTTRNNKIGIIGTTATISTSSYTNEIKKIDSKYKIFSQSCPLFVPIIEEGWETTEVAYLTAQQYLAPLISFNIDTLVLGCTHYPLIKDTINQVLNNKITLVDSAEETSLEISEFLKKENLNSEDITKKFPKFYLSDIPPNFPGMAERFLGEPITHVERV